MPLAERVEGRDFRILVIKYFSGACSAIVFAHRTGWCSVLLC